MYVFYTLCVYNLVFCKVQDCPHVVCSVFEHIVNWNVVLKPEEFLLTNPHPVQQVILFKHILTNKSFFSNKRHYNPFWLNKIK